MNTTKFAIELVARGMYEKNREALELAGHAFQSYWKDCDEEKRECYLMYAGRFLRDHFEKRG